MKESIIKTEFGYVDFSHIISVSNLEIAGYETADEIDSEDSIIYFWGNGKNSIYHVNNKMHHCDLKLRQFAEFYVDFYFQDKPHTFCINLDKEKDFDNFKEKCTNMYNEFIENWKKYKS